MYMNVLCIAHSRGECRIACLCFELKRFSTNMRARAYCNYCDLGVKYNVRTADTWAQIKWKLVYAWYDRYSIDGINLSAVRPTICLPVALSVDSYLFYYYIVRTPARLAMCISSRDRRSVIRLLLSPFHPLSLSLCPQTPSVHYITQVHVLSKRGLTYPESCLNVNHSPRFAALASTIQDKMIKGIIDGKEMVQAMNYEKR